MSLRIPGLQNRQSLMCDYVWNWKCQNANRNEDSEENVCKVLVRTRILLEIGLEDCFTFLIDVTKYPTKVT